YELHSAVTCPLSLHDALPIYKGRGKGHGLGFDYWLGDAGQDLPFMHDLRLEVSGVLKGTPSEVRRRLDEKVRQVGRSQLPIPGRSEEHTSELQSRENLVCRLL